MLIYAILFVPLQGDSMAVLLCSRKPQRILSCIGQTKSLKRHFLKWAQLCNERNYMKKYLMKLAAILSCVMTIAVLTACGDSDDNSATGDWIECDGIRGKVTAINYQCVQAETIEGTEMSFLNSSLFGKNFNNLTQCDVHLTPDAMGQT